MKITLNVWEWQFFKDFRFGDAEYSKKLPSVHVGRRCLLREHLGGVPFGELYAFGTLLEDSHIISRLSSVCCTAVCFE